MGNYQSSKTENIDLNENVSKLDNEVNVTYKVQNNFQNYIYLVLIRTLYGSENKVMFSYDYMDIYNYIESFKKNIYNENSFINVEESPIENQYIYKKYESIPLENLNEKYINSINETKLLYSLRFYKELKNIINSSQNHISSLYIYKVYKMDHIDTEDDNITEDNGEEDNGEQTTEEQTTEDDIVEQIEELEGDLPPLEDLLKLLPPPPPLIRSTNTIGSRRTGSMSLPSSPRFIRKRGLTIIDTHENKEINNNIDLYNSEELPPLPPSDDEDN